MTSSTEYHENNVIVNERYVFYNICLSKSVQKRINQIWSAAFQMAWMEA